MQTIESETESHWSIDHATEHPTAVLQGRLVDLTVAPLVQGDLWARFWNPNIWAVPKTFRHPWASLSICSLTRTPMADWWQFYVTSSDFIWPYETMNTQIVWALLITRQCPIIQRHLEFRKINMLAEALPSRPEQFCKGSGSNAPIPVPPKRKDSKWKRRESAPCYYWTWPCFAAQLHRITICGCLLLATTKANHTLWTKLLARLPFCVFWCFFLSLLSLKDWKLATVHSSTSVSKVPKLNKEGFSGPGFQYWRISSVTEGPSELRWDTELSDLS